VEVGGWNPKFWSQNPPPEMLETWARNEAMFNLYLAQQLPQVKIVASSSKKLAGDDLYEVELSVTNEGLMPTSLEIARRVKMVRPDTCTITLAKGQTLAPRSEGEQPQRASIEIDVLNPGETKRVSWQVKGAGTATVAISSTRGGVDRRDVILQ
jgi:hypothetical protein